MTDAQFFGAWIVGCLTLWLFAVLFACALGRAAAKPPPPMPDPWTRYFAGEDWATLADRMENARGWGSGHE